GEKPTLAALEGAHDGVIVSKDRALESPVSTPVWKPGLIVENLPGRPAQPVRTTVTEALKLILHFGGRIVLIARLGHVSVFTHCLLLLAPNRCFDVCAAVLVPPFTVVASRRHLRV